MLTSPTTGTSMSPSSRCRDTAAQRPLICQSCRFRTCLCRERETSIESVREEDLASLPGVPHPPRSPPLRVVGPAGLKGPSVPRQVGVLEGLGGAPQEMGAWRTAPEQLLKGAAGLGAADRPPRRMTPRLLPLLLLLAGPPAARPTPPTCYSRMLSLSREITGHFRSLQATEPAEPCVRYLPRLYLDIHNYCVLAKLRDFVASPQCWRVAQVDALRDKVRKLYTIMNSFCRRDLVFLSDDCNALEYPIPVTTALPGHQS